MLSENKRTESVRSYKRSTAKFFLWSAIFAAIAVSTSYGNTSLQIAETADISGTVTFNGTPLTALVIANGRHMFTGGTQPGLQKGEFQFLSVPFDTNGRITLYAFVSGYAPYKTILNEGVSAFEIEMLKDAGGKEINVVIDTLTNSTAKPGWVDIGGTIENLAGTPLCALALSNGQRIFTCNASLGRFDLTVPLDGNGRITLYAFASGFKPYKKIIDLSDSFFGLSTDLGVVGHDLDIVIYGRDFQAGSNVVMIPEIYKESRILASLTNQDDHFGVTALSEDMVFYAGRGSGFGVIDLSDPTAPQIIGHTELPDSNFYDMTICGDVAYIAGFEGVQMVDVFDPGNPQVIGTIVLPGYSLKYTRCVRVIGNIAFVIVSGAISDPDSLSSNFCTLYTIDISDPANCSILGSITLPGECEGFEIHDELALFYHRNGLVGIDISNPEFLEETDTIEVSGAGKGCRFNQTAFVTCDDQNIIAINISDPLDMKIEGQMKMPDSLYSHGLTVSGESLFLFSYRYIWKIDITEPEKMRIVGNVSEKELSGSNELIFIKDDMAFFFAKNYELGISEFYVMDISDMEDPGARLEGIAGIVTVQNAGGLILEQNTLYVSQGDSGVSIIDVGDPEQPKRIDDQSISDFASVMAVSDNIMYTGYENRIRIYSVEDPKYPVPLSSLDLPDENIHLLEVMGDVLFAGANTCESGCWSRDECYYHCDNYLRAIGVFSPNNPLMFGDVSIPADQSYALIISDGTGYLAGRSEGHMPDFGMISWSENYIVNLNNPFFPKISSTMMGGSLIGKEPSDDTLFMIHTSDDYYDDFEGWLVALDIGESMKVEEISRLSIPHAGIPSLNMNTVHLASSYYDVETHEKTLAIYAMDVANPENMRNVVNMTFPQPFADIWEIKDMVVENNLAYLALGDDGIIILPLPREAKKVTVNSSSRISATLPGPEIPGTYAIKVIDESGNEDTVGTITFCRITN